MVESNILDKIEKIMNKKFQVAVKDLSALALKSWEEAKKSAQTIILKPGWAVFFARKEGFIDHIAIVPGFPTQKLNLAKTPLLHATAPPIGKGIGPLTSTHYDQSGLRLSTAFDFIEEYQDHYSYEKLFFGPPPVDNLKKINRAGEIARQIAKTGLLDGQPVVFSFGMVPIIKNFFVSFYNEVNHKATITPIKKIHKTVKPLYCGGLVGEIWKKAGIKNIPQVRVFNYRGYSSFSLFKWCHEQIGVKGISWLK